MRPSGSPDLIADRRRRALRLLDQGFSLHEVARQIECAPVSVMRWRDAREKHGEDVFQVKLPPGRPPRLSPAQGKRLVKLLLKGPLACGYRTDLWTTQRIADLVEKKFGIRYHRDHIGRLMAKLGWSHQKPERRAMERDEERIEHWKKTDWPRIKKTPRGWAPISFLSTNRDSC